MIRISRVSLRNFKSFRRASIPIPRGFTAIVGPNGSGKSNIVDALCFVLGRSSAKSLRAERFSDLIFNGGRREKPAKEAEVVLYLDNAGRELPTDEKEVKISRSVDVDGNSVYRMNGRRSNRSEILDLLANANIQPDGHNIVLQGDVTKIVEMSPLERRGLIDEIAGIAEYDERKRKALRELEKVNDNTSKVEAVIVEVGSNLSKLTEEREDALRHEELKGEVRRSRGMVLYSHRLETEGKLEELEESLSKAEEELGRMDKFLDVLALKHEVKKQELERVNIEIAAKEEADRFQAFKDLERARNELAAWTSKEEELGEKLTTVDGEYEVSKNEIVHVHGDIKRCREENAIFQREIGELEARIAELRENVEETYRRASKGHGDASEIRGRLRVTREAFDEKQRELLEAEREESLLSIRLQEKDAVLQGLADEVKDGKTKLGSLSSERRALSKRAKEAEVSLKKLASEETSVLDALSETRRNLGEIDASMEVKLREQARLRARCQAIEEISNRGLERAVEEVLSLRDGGKKGIYGTLSELGKVDRKFFKALSAAAGRGLEFIVVEDENVAEECIGHLKESKAGRATFLPLSKLRTRKPTHKQLALAKKCHGFAVNLVSFTPKFKGAFAYVFRNTIVVDDIKVAKRLGIGEARMVTLDGDLIEQSGAMSGGYFKPLGGFEEVDESRRKLERINKEISKLETERGKLLKREDELKNSMEGLNGEVLELEKEKSKLDGKISSLEERISDLVRTIAGMEVQSREEASTLKELKKTLKESRSKSKAVSEELGGLRKEKEVREAKLEGTGEERTLKEIRAIEDEILELEKGKEGKLAGMGLNDSRIVDILQPKFDAIKRRIVELHASRKGMREEISRSEVDRRELSGRVEELEKKVEEVSKELEELRGRRDSLIKAAVAMERKRDALKERHLQVRRTMEDSRIEKARHEAKQEDVLKALEEYADLNIELIAPMDTVELEKEIARMEAEMRALEPINMRAVEDYEGVKEKFDALDNRMGKLLEEKEAIQRLMEEIEHRKTSVFMEVFENIAMNFTHIFAELSNGGAADLILDEENPLEGGLQIQVRPVGKNIQYIELMSGGEKTLTAVSLIFAVQRYQPAPFYILDEVDMFLDDENLRRVSDLVKESSKGAQFIVVSLRDSLMASADQLFGVANEDGISKIIGVELQEVGSASG
ncbi:MAG: chromosome segregation protein SMC [Candidatus Hydrothermarchaeaceae archaeon]